MSLLVSSGVNTIVVTLSEKTTIATPYYLLKIYNTESEHFCVVTETSDDTTVYNRFTLTLKSSPTALDGEVDLKVGEYSYIFYEQDMNDNLNPTGLKVVETGLLVCKPATKEALKKYSNNEQIKIYRG